MPDLVPHVRPGGTLRRRPQPVLDAEALAYAQVWAERWRAERRAGWAVVRGDEHAGRIMLRSIDHQQGCAEVASWVVPAARGTGVAPAAVEAFTAWAFGEAGLELQQSTGNPASCRVADRTGVALEGTSVRSLPHDDGWHDMHLHARVSDE